MKLIAMKTIMFIIIFALAIVFLLLIPIIGPLWLLSRIKVSDDVMIDENNYGLERDGIKWQQGR